MVARIHYVRNGIEYVLQYNSNTDTIESREHLLMLIGGVPNYFRDNGLGTALEVHTFKITLRNWRPLTTFSEALNRLPMLSDEEKTLIHKFEEIADINLCLTPESVSRHRLESMQEIARLPGIDISATVSYASVLQSLRRSNEQAPTEEESVQNVIPRMPEALEEQLTHTADSLRAANPDMNTEGLTEEQVEENLEFVARLLNGETLSARENPPLSNPNTDDTDSAPDPNLAETDTLLKEIDDVLADEAKTSDEVWGAPTHIPFLDADTMSKMWKQAKAQD